MLSCLITKAQSVYHTVYSQRATWNTYTQKWDYEPANYGDLTFTMQGHVILVNDQANSTYTTGTMTIKIEDKDPKQYGWEAIDEKYRKCLFKIEYYESGIEYFVVMYDDMLWSYRLTTGTKLDKF